MDVVAVVDQVMALQPQERSGLSHHTHAQAPAGGLFNLYPLLRGRHRCTLEACVPR